MRGLVVTQKPKVPEEADAGQIPPASASIGNRPFYQHGEWKDARLFEMEALKAGNRIAGPAIIESPATTFVVPDGWVTDLDVHRIFHLREV
jgi:acetone carboxylase, beta subunit